MTEEGDRYVARPGRCPGREVLGTKTVSVHRLPVVVAEDTCRRVGALAAPGSGLPG